MGIVSWCAVAFLAPGLLLATIGRQRLVEIEFKQFKDQWERDGRPVGGSESRRASSFWTSGQATQRVTLGWLTQTPEWVKESPDAMSALRRLRLGVSLLMAGILATVGVAAWTS